MNTFLLKMPFYIQGGVHFKASTPINITVIKIITPAAIRTFINIFLSPILVCIYMLSQINPNQNKVR